METPPSPNSPQVWHKPLTLRLKWETSFWDYSEIYLCLTMVSTSNSVTLKQKATYPLRSVHTYLYLITMEFIYINENKNPGGLILSIRRQV